MRWLMIALLVSVCALIVASAGVAWHVWRQHRKPPQTPAGGDPSDMLMHEEIEREEAP